MLNVPCTKTHSTNSAIHDNDKDDNDVIDDDDDDDDDCDYVGMVWYGEEDNDE